CPFLLVTGGGMDSRNRTSPIGGIEWAVHVSERDVTMLLKAWRGGEDAALGELIPLVHDELHRLARACMYGERHGRTLQATALVNEAYLRLGDVHPDDWHNPPRLLSRAARARRPGRAHLP